MQTLNCACGATRPHCQHQISNMQGTMAAGPQQLFAEWQTKFNEFKQKNDAADIAVTTLASAAQGVFIGYLLGSFSMDQAGQQGSNPQVSAQLAALQKGGPWGQARNLGVFTGVNAGLSLAIKKARGGKEDVWGRCACAVG